MNIINKKGNFEPFDLDKIEEILDKIKEIDLTKRQTIISNILKDIDKKEIIDIYELNELVKHNIKMVSLIGYQKYEEAEIEKEKIRDKNSQLMKTIHKIGIETDRDNANVGNNFSSKLLRIASESNKWHNLNMMPKDLAKLHENGDLYYHDLDSFNLTINCLNVDTGKILKNGFNTGYGTINPPKRIESAAELSCILLQSTQNDMFGGQSHTNFDIDMAPFVDMTRKEILTEEIENAIIYDNNIDSCIGEVLLTDLSEQKQKQVLNKTEQKLKKIVHQSMQGIVYNLNTMHSRAGSQVPFSSINLGIPKGDTEQEENDAALVCQCFLEEYEKGLGKSEQPIFPNIIFRVKKGINKNPRDPYYYLYKLACRVASKRMNPMFMNLDADFNKEYYDKGILPATMGCRTYVCSNINGEDGPKSRGNIAPTTINLPRLGIEAKSKAIDFLIKDIQQFGVETLKNDLDKLSEIYFYRFLREKLLLARESLLYRYDVLKKLKVKDLPFVAGQKLIKGSEDLNPNDSIEPILKQGTWGIGFIGLAEALIALTGKHHGEDKKIHELGIKIVSMIREFCDKYKETDKLNWSCYATPAEGLSGKFILKDKEKYGIIPGVTDKDYYTNSYHIPVGYKISINNKIDLEAPFHKICNGGHITYIELDGYPEPEDVKAIIDYAYNNTNINYIGINFHMRYCKNCGERIYSNEQKCPACESTDIQGISRVTGYLSLDERFGAGKIAERKDRISHTNFKNNY